MTVITKSHRDGNVANGQRGRTEQGLCAVNSALHDILVRREAGAETKQVSKVRLAQSGRGSQVGQPEILSEPIFDYQGNLLQLTRRQSLGRQRRRSSPTEPRQRRNARSVNA
jgi:hypothetical protein